MWKRFLTRIGWLVPPTEIEHRRQAWAAPTGRPIAPRIWESAAPGDSARAQKHRSLGCGRIGRPVGVANEQ